MVTVRQLLSMRSGINDYDDDALMQWTYAHPGRDYTPLDFIASVNKTAICDPGACGAYSSVGYEVLGLLLAWHSGARGSWSEFDQLSVLPDRLIAEIGNDTTFMMQGRCSQYPDVIHQYASRIIAAMSSPSKSSPTMVHVRLTDHSSNVLSLKVKPHHRCDASHVDVSEVVHVQRVEHLRGVAGLRVQGRGGESRQRRGG